MIISSPGIAPARTVFRNAAMIVAALAALGVPALAATGSASALDPLPAPPRVDFATWHEVPVATGSGGVALAPDAVSGVWYADNARAELVHTSPGGAVSHVAIPAGGYVESIVMTPDHLLWFTDAAHPRISRLDPVSGTVDTFSLPLPSDRAVDATVGPDGNVWFADPAAGSLGTVDSAGVLSLVPLAGSPTVERLVTSTDGAIWFTVAGDSTVHRFDPLSGLVLDVDLPFGAPFGLEATPSGQIWVGVTDALIRLSLDGAVERIIPLPGGSPAHVRPIQLTAGVHAPLYFRDTNLGICTVDVTDAVHCALPPFEYAAPSWITVDAIGALWLTDRYEDVLRWV